MYGAFFLFPRIPLFLKKHIQKIVKNICHIPSKRPNVQIGNIFHKSINK